MIGAQYGEADAKANNVALKCLLETPYSILSEESGMVDRHGPYLIVVDPLDGSANFARRVPFAAVSLCALWRGLPIAGLVLDVITRDCYFASTDSPFTLNSVEVTYPLVRGHLPLVSGLRSSTDRMSARQFGAAALELALVACGALDGFVAPGSDPPMPWDYLAGAYLVERSGGLVANTTGADLWAVTGEPARLIACSRSARGDKTLFAQLATESAGPE